MERTGASGGADSERGGLTEPASHVEAGTRAGIELPPLALYIHLPWCVRKCPYCDFNSHEAPTEIPEDAYVDALIADLETDLPWAQGRTVDSVFFGGGTPSLFSPSALRRLLNAIEARLALAGDVEITLEANPGTVEQARFEGFREAGINRLSLGVQSFDRHALTRLGRIHGPQEAITAAESARRAGFQRLNLDLMHGLPQQSPDAAQADLAQALALAPGHISWYQLTLEPNTVFHRYPPALPDEATLEAIQQQGEALLASHGYRRYEVSAFARPGEQCRHNRHYWLFSDYIGIGAGAHGKLTDPASGRLERRWKTRQPAAYLDPDKPYEAGRQPIAAADRAFEFVMNAFRLNEPIPPALFTARTGLTTKALERPMAQAIERGLVADTEAGWCLTERGQRFLNELLVLFLERA